MVHRHTSVLYTDTRAYVRTYVLYYTIHTYVRTVRTYVRKYIRTYVRIICTYVRTVRTYKRTYVRTYVLCCTYACSSRRIQHSRPPHTGSLLLFCVRTYVLRRTRHQCRQECRLVFAEAFVARIREKVRAYRGEVGVWSRHAKFRGRAKCGPSTSQLHHCAS